MGLMTSFKVTISGETINCKNEVTPLELLKKNNKKNGIIYCGARVKHRIIALNTVIKEDCALEFIDVSNPHGLEIYRRSTALVLARAVFELQRNSRLSIYHSMANSFYYDFYTDIPITDEMLQPIEKRMRSIIKKNEAIILHIQSREEAIKFFKKRAYADKVRLLQNIRDNEIKIYSCGKFHDLCHGPLLPSTGFIRGFHLKRYGDGFLLSFPNPKNPAEISPVINRPKLFNVYQESKRWAKILEVNDVGRFNEMVVKKGGHELVQIAESLHEKKIAAISDEICQKKKETKLILIAGPSSSGKTTFSKRLRIHLRVNGIDPIVISLDDYFIDREAILKKGQAEFENIDALDLKLLNEHLETLMKGGEIEQPIFDFETGSRKPIGKKFRMFEDQLLIIEGIHGLNDKLTYKIPANLKYKIYISALTQLSIDDYNRISTTTIRLIRRIVRDNLYRGYSAYQTIKSWPLVRGGEERNIFPFQEEADAMFNSGLIYEPAILKGYIKPLVSGIPKDTNEYYIGTELTRFTNLFHEIPSKYIPSHSILREFIG